MLKRSVLRQIGGKELQSGAGIGRDCAILAFPEDEGITACMQEGAVALGGRKEPEPFMTIGELVQKCANNLAAGGSRPFAFMVTLLMPEGAEEADIRALMAEAEAKTAEISAETAKFAAEESATEKLAFEPLKLQAEKSEIKKAASGTVRIIGGQTRITCGAAFPYAVITGFGGFCKKTSTPTKNIDTGGSSEAGSGAGRSRSRADEGSGGPEAAGKARPGQDVVLSKWIGLQGTAVLAERNRERLSERYPAWLAEKAAGFGAYLSVLPEAEIAVRAGAGAMHDASEGGILAALWELAERSGTGLVIDMRKLPLRQETVEICEFCNVNPYELMSGGCLIMTADNGERLAAALEQAGIPAAAVGKVTDSKDRLLINGDEVRYMDRPHRDGIYDRPKQKEQGRRSM